MEHRDDIKVVFLVANSKTVEDQADLGEEHDQHGDIAQCDVQVIGQCKNNVQKGQWPSNSNGDR